MGEPKALLDLHGRTFLESAVDALLNGGCTGVVVVVPGEEVVVEEVSSGGRASIADLARRLPVTTVFNPDRGSEQIDSLRVALEALPSTATGALVLPVDHPLVSAHTVAALIAASRSNPDAVVRPTREGTPGHPTLFPRALWRLLFDPSLPRGARSVVESADTRTVEVAVDDPGVVADIDTPAAYRRYAEGYGGDAP